MRFATRLVHHPGACCPHTGAVSTPIYQASTYRQDGVGRNRGYDYSRSGNPTREALEEYIAELEGGQEGYAFSSGMAAISGCLMLLEAGDHVVATQGLYGGTYRVLRRVFEDFDISCTFADTGDPEGVKRAFRDNTRAVLVETPSNPTMRITDLAAVAELAHRREALLMVDNTFMSPWLQRPLEAEADLVIHSGTKFLGGHSDVIAGLAVPREASVAKRLKRIQNSVGAVLSPFDSWVLMRGMKTLGLRMERGQDSAGKIARWLAERPDVRRVLYPSMGTLEGEQVHRSQADGPGAVLSFLVDESVSARRLVEEVEVWTLAVSLGAVESIITLPARMTHLPYPAEDRERLGIGDDLVRLSVGIEDPRDLIEDLQAAFEAARTEG